MPTGVIYSSHWDTEPPDIPVDDPPWSPFKPYALMSHEPFRPRFDELVRSLLSDTLTHEEANRVLDQMAFFDIDGDGLSDRGRYI